MNFLGDAYRSIREFKRAMDFHKLAIEMFKQVGNRALEGFAEGCLGVAYRCIGNCERSIESHEEHLAIATEIGDKAGEGRASGNLGAVHRSLGDCKPALEYHKKDLSIAKETGDKNREGFALFCLGRAHERLDALQEALEYFRSSLHLFNKLRATLGSEDMWKIYFRKKCKNAYTAVWRTLLKLGKPAEALYEAELGRGQALKELMELQYGSGWLHSELPDPKETISRMVNGMSTPILFIALEKEVIHLWLLKGKGKIQYEKKNIDEIALVVKKASKEIRYAFKCENRSLDEPGEHQRSLYNSVLGPIIDSFEGEELIIVPDGPLCLAPFHAFMSPARKYLCEYFMVRIIPSLTSLHMITTCPDDHHSKSGALLVGDPWMEEIVDQSGSPKFKQLKGAQEEIQMLGKMFNTTPVLGRDATKDEVLKRITSVALVHIAAHTNKKTGEIVLAPNPTRQSKVPEEKDYMLKMEDLLRLQLRAKLVVLSSSNTAKGLVTPEGVVGIARAFLAAGARSVVASIWGVHDESTVLFMKCFYQHLAEGKSASKALFLAINAVRMTEKFDLEKYWAPFTLFGDDVTLEVGESGDQQHCK